jgi:WhiB family redox-sensing transcriptional regulator
VTAEPAAGTRRARILAHLVGHPDLTAHELARLIGTASTVTDLLRDMQLKGQVIARTERRPQQGRPVHLWRIAPPGTVPPPRSSQAAEIVARRRERDRRATAARRARIRPPAPQPTALSLPGAACRTADPALFFPEPGDTAAEARAVAICAACPVRAGCYARAAANREQWGVWGGVNFEAARPSQRDPEEGTSMLTPISDASGSSVVIESGASSSGARVVIESGGASSGGAAIVMDGGGAGGIEVEAG